jgi:hypothetical protein
LYAACRIVTEPYIGTILPDGPQPLIRDALFRELSKIRHVQIDSVTVDVYSSLAVFTQLPGSSAPESIVGALMQVVVEGVIYDEILSIQFFLSVQ